MKNTDEYELNRVLGDKVQYPTNCLTASLYRVDPVQSDTLKSVMKHCTDKADILLDYLLMFRGKSVVINRFFVKSEELNAKLLSLKKKLGCQINDADFIKMAKEFYESYIEMSPRETANIFFNVDKKDAKCKNLPAHLWDFVNSGLFPIQNNLNSSLRYSVCATVQSTLKSFETKEKDYESAKNSWFEKRNASNLKFIEDYELFLSDLNSCESLGKDTDKFRIDADKFSRFIGAWRGKYDKETSTRAPGIKDLMRKTYSENPKYVFQEDSKYMFGYSADVLNAIFKNKNLWLDNVVSNTKNDVEFDDRDIIGNNSYLDLIFKHFHWRKDGVNIPSFGQYGKYVKISFGENFVKFNLVKEISPDGKTEFKFEINSLTSNKDDKMSFTLCHSPHFSETTEISKVPQQARAKKKTEGEAKDEKEETEAQPKKDKIFQITYSGDSKKKTYYTGTIKEPSMRWDSIRNRFYISFPVSNHQEVGNTVDLRKLSDSKWFLKSADFSGEKIKGGKEHKFHYDNFRVMGVDLGLSNPFVATIFDATHKDGVINLEKEVKIVKSWRNSNSDYINNLIDTIQKGINALKNMMFECNDYITERIEKISGVVTRRDISCSWAKDLGIDVNVLMSGLNKYRNSADKEKAIQLFKMDNIVWPMTNELRNLKSKMTILRTAYFKSGDKARYCREDSKVDMTVFRKRDIIKQYIGLLRAFTSLGLKTSSQDFKKKYKMTSFCSSYAKWYRGLTRKMNDVTSAIINVARENNVQFVFIEDLEARPSAFDDREDNRLKSLWGFGAMKVALANKARKHNVAVIAVDPTLTSKIYYPTGKVGRFEKRNLVVGDISVDRDINASRNIAYRGISRGKDIRKFFVDRVGDNLYKLCADANEGGKLKAAAVYALFKSKEVLFEKIGDTYRVVSTNLNKEQKKLPVIKEKNERNKEKKHVIILDGDTWREYDWRVG